MVKEPQKIQNSRYIIDLLKSLFTGYSPIEVCKLIKSYLLVFRKYRLIGSSIRIETSTFCQLDCPRCFVKTEQVGLGYLKFADFKKFVDTYPEFRNIELASKGEIFLNPELNEIIQYAHLKKVNLTAFNGVNLNTVSEKTLEYLVKYRFKAIVVSIDGVNNDTYKVYRRGGNFNVVIENINKINHYKKKYNSAHPHLYWQFILFGHNEHELIAARRMAKALDMHFKAIFNYDLDYSPIINKEFVRKEVGAASIKEYEQKTGTVYMPLCLQLWSLPQINWDGRLLGCCSNQGIDFGNVFSAGLEKCLKQKRYLLAKRLLFHKVTPSPDIPCADCGSYKIIQSLPNKAKLIKSIIPLVFRRMESSIFY